MLRLLAGAALAGATALALAGTAQSQGNASLQTQLVREINTLRQAHGLPAVRACAPLAVAAREHDADMLTNGFFGHASFDGTTFAARIRDRYRRAAVGENLLWVTGSTSAAAVVASWATSASHRANLLDPRWRHIGVSATAFAASPGVFADATGLVVTADFAS
jgi:uncharacterized protein YkwD